MNQDPFHAGAAPLQAYADLQAALEPGYGDDGWTWEWHNTLGSVAGLLITKWAGCGEALTLPRDDQPAVDHATALLGVLREVSSRLAVPLNVQPVKLPLMTLAETRPETYKAIVAWSRGIDLDSSDGRQVAAGAFDAAVRVAVHQQRPACRRVHHTLTSRRSHA